MFQNTKASTAALSTALAFGAASLPAAKADGAIMKSYPNRQANYDFAASRVEFTRTVAVHGVLPPQFGGAAVTASGYLIAPTLVLHSGHFSPPEGSQGILTHISLGANYNSPDLQIPIERWERFPGFNQNDPTTVDLGFIWLAEPVPGFTERTRYGTISVGETAALIDYGNVGDPIVGELPSEGYRIGGTAYRVTRNNNPYPETLYDFFRFDGLAAVDPLNVQAADKSSGGGILTLDGALSHIIAARTLGTTGGVTAGVDLNVPFIREEIRWREDLSFASVPEPVALAPAAVLASVLLPRRRR